MNSRIATHLTSLTAAIAVTAALLLGLNSMATGSVAADSIMAKAAVVKTA